MKTDIIALENTAQSLEAVLKETEKASAWCGLEKKPAGRLRLLAEELVGMLPELLSFSRGEFWIEADGKSFELHTALTPATALTADLREKLLAVASDGKNAAAKGVMNKIRLAASFMLLDYEQSAAMMPAMNEFYHDGMTNVSFFPSASWSMNAWRIKAEGAKGEAWDELEKSIVANIADDVIVGVQGKRVDIIVKKSF
ncbi:MAG: hypothetical protein K6G80_09925 [Treponema sp.]|nr:hypothetical protein [Treponema sp.]